MVNKSTVQSSARKRKPFATDVADMSEIAIMRSEHIPTAGLPEQLPVVASHAFQLEHGSVFGII